MALNEWHHILGIWDGSKLGLYIDGVFKSSSAAVTSTETGTQNIDIGKRANVNGFRFNGKLDDVRIWNRDLLASEPKLVYNDSRAGYPDTLNWIKQRLVVTVAGGTILPQMMQIAS